MDNSHYSQYPNMNASYMQQSGSVDSNRTQYPMHPPVNYPPFPPTGSTSMAQSSGTATNYYGNVSSHQQNYSSSQQQMYNMPPNGFPDNQSYNSSWNYPQESYTSSLGMNDPNYMRPNWNMPPYDSSQQWPRPEAYPPPPPQSQPIKESYPSSMEYSQMGSPYYPPTTKYNTSQYGSYPSYPSQQQQQPQTTQPAAAQAAQVFPPTEAYAQPRSESQSKQTMLSQQRQPADYPMSPAPQAPQVRHSLPVAKSAAQEFHSSRPRMPMPAPNYVPPTSTKPFQHPQLPVPQPYPAKPPVKSLENGISPEANLATTPSPSFEKPKPHFEHPHHALKIDMKEVPVERSSPDLKSSPLLNIQVSPAAVAPSPPSCQSKVQEQAKEPSPPVVIPVKKEEPVKELFEPVIVQQISSPPVQDAKKEPAAPPLLLPNEAASPVNDSLPTASYLTPTSVAPPTLQPENVQVLFLINP
ncbi:hypothetical protein Ciccas_001421 [Cichlidogyrus casuarinus]|uniref:Enamelin n=1 Tax=Cichlidogyrus casuarinus TaxID=1844966 RepID=A0ABD2QK51_9PLAT